MGVGKERLAVSRCCAFAARERALRTLALAGRAKQRAGVPLVLPPSYNRLPCRRRQAASRASAATRLARFLGNQVLASHQTLRPPPPQSFGSVRCEGVEIAPVGRKALYKSSGYVVGPPFNDGSAQGPVSTLLLLFYQAWFAMR